MEYFMDKIEEWEVIELLQMLNYADRNQWDQTRCIMYVLAQANSKKKLTMKDVMEFPWDKEYNSKSKEITNEQIDKLRKMAEQYKKTIIDKTT